MFVYLLKTTFLLFIPAFLSKVVSLSLAGNSPVNVWSASGLYALLWGMRLDLVMVAILTTLITLIAIASIRFPIFRRFPSWMTIISAIGLVIVTVIDSIYGIETGAHITFELFTAQDSELALIMTALEIAPFSIIAGILLCVCSVFLYKYLKPDNNITSIRFSKLTTYAVSLLWIGFTVTTVRGGWLDAPQSPMSANKIGDSRLAYLAWSSPYSMAYYGLKGPKRAAKQVTPALDLDVIPPEPANIDHLKKANIVLVLLESWASVDMQSYANQVNATPFFDQLREKSLSPRAMYANGHRTVQGLFASVCSYPNPIGSIVAGTQLQTFSYSCLPELLKNHGWSTHFIQGSGKGIVGQFAQFLGYQYSYGKRDYPFSAEKNYWGYMDDGIYRFTLDKIRQLEHKDSPWLVTINTGTTHDSYLPDNVPYAFGKNNRTQVRRSVVHYADQALSRFITTLDQVVQKPTLVILVADHTMLGKGHDLSKYSIPFLMYATDGSVPSEEIDVTASQIDIAPTIIDWLGGDIPWFIGGSLLKPETLSNTASYSSGETIGWIENQNFVRFNARTNAVESCASVDDDSIRIKTESCRNDNYQVIAKNAIKFTQVSQQLLFQGETDKYSSKLIKSNEQDTDHQMLTVITHKKQ